MTPAAGFPCLSLVLPDDRDAVSGGNLYNAHLCAALARTGAAHQALDFAGACARAGSGGPAVFLVDSVLHDRLPESVRHTRPGQRVLLLVHYLPMFEHVFERKEPAARALAETRRLLLRVSGFVANSSFTENLLGQLAGARPILVVPPALVLVPPGHRPGGAGFRALLVGNLIRAKGILPLLHQLALLLGEDDRFVLDVLGRSDLEPEYAGQCRAVLGRSPRLARAVRLRGVVAPRAMPGVYEESSVLVSAAELETYGMALAEARAFGLPILALDAGNARAHVSAPEHGRLHATAADLAAACLAFAREPAALARLREDAFRTRVVPGRTWEDAARELTGGLARVLAGDSPQVSGDP